MSWTHSWPSGLQRAWAAPPLWLFIICTRPCWSHWIRPALPLTCCCPWSHLCSDLSNMLGSSALFHLHRLSPGLYPRTPNLPHDAKPQDARLLWFWSFHCSRGFILTNGLFVGSHKAKPSCSPWLLQLCSFHVAQTGTTCERYYTIPSSAASLRGRLGPLWTSCADAEKTLKISPQWCQSLINQS